MNVNTPPAELLLTSRMLQCLSIEHLNRLKRLVLHMIQNQMH